MSDMTTDTAGRVTVTVTDRLADRQQVGGPDALLVALDQHSVRTGPPSLGPPVPLQCRQHPRRLGHGSTVGQGYDKTGAGALIAETRLPLVCTDRTATG
jgi:hypothetical protein